MSTRFLLFMGVLLLYACATPYQRYGFSGGYSETQLRSNVFRVAFNGNGYTSLDRVIEYTMLRSAEVALEHGFKYYIIIDGNSYFDADAITTPTTTYGSATIYGNTIYGHTTTVGGGTFYISKPATVNTIVCFSEKPTSGAYRDAQDDADFYGRIYRKGRKKEKSKSDSGSEGQQEQRSD